jgi:uncharacterized membrane protein
MNAKGWTDQRIEVIIGSLLRVGVLLAASVVLIGGVLYEVRHGSEMINYTTFHGEPEALKSIPAVVDGVLSFHARAIIQLGLLLLIATPIARVVFSAVAFAIEKDYLYVAITLIVLAILLYSLLGSAG